MYFMFFFSVFSNKTHSVYSFNQYFDQFSTFFAFVYLRLNINITAKRKMNNQWFWYCGCSMHACPPNVDELHFISFRSATTIARARANEHQLANRNNYKRLSFFTISLVDTGYYVEKCFAMSGTMF